MMAFVRSVIEDGIKLAPGVIAQLLGGFAVNILLAKILLPEQFGEYSLFVLGQAYLVSLVFGWFQNAIIRFKSGADSFADVFTFGKKLFFLLGIMLGIITLLGFELLPFNTAMLFFLAMLLFLAGSAFTTLQCLYRASFKTMSFSWNAMLLALLKVSFLGGLLFLWGDGRRDVALPVVFLLLILSHVLVVLWQLLRFHHRSAPLSSRAMVGKQEVMRWIRYGFPLSLSLLVISLLQSADRYLLAILTTLKEVGVYAFWMGMGMQLGQGVYRLLFMALNPRLFQAHERTPSTSYGRIEALTWGYAIWFAPFCVLIGMYLPETLQAFGVSAEYNEGSWIAMFGAFSSFMLGFAQLLGKKLELNEKTWVFIFAAIASLGVMVVVDLGVVRQFGLIGACFGNVLALFTYGVVLAWKSQSLPMLIIGALGGLLALVIGWMGYFNEYYFGGFLAVITTVVEYFVLCSTLFWAFVRLKKPKVV